MVEGLSRVKCPCLRASIGHAFVIPAREFVTRPAPVVRLG